MTGYNKIVPEIIESSIWNESAETRCVWIMFISTKDENGYVRGDSRTLARKANVTVEAVEAALQCFQNPDPTSHTPDNEGRRIIPAPGGWTVLNHDIYRQIGMSEANKTYWKEKKRLQRAQNVSDIPRQVSDSSVSVSASDSEKGSQEGKTNYSEDFLKFWQAYPRKIAKGKAWDAWRKRKPNLGKCLTALEWQTKCEQWTKENGQFVPYPASYINASRWDDEQQGSTSQEPYSAI